VKVSRADALPLAVRKAELPIQREDVGDRSFREETAGNVGANEGLKAELVIGFDFMPDDRWPILGRPLPRLQRPGEVPVEKAVNVHDRSSAAPTKLLGTQRAGGGRAVSHLRGHAVDPFGRPVQRGRVEEARGHAQARIGELREIEIQIPGLPVCVGLESNPLATQDMVQQARVETRREPEMPWSVVMRGEVVDDLLDQRKG